MFNFNQKKFKSLSFAQQHKKCSEMLQHVYLKMQANLSVKEELVQYQNMRLWIGLNSFFNVTLEEISNLFHWHLKHARLFTREHHLLPPIRQGDKESGEPFWPISIFLDSIRSAFNVGSILRTTEAMRMGKLYFSDQMAFTDNRQVQQASMETYRWVQCHQNIPLETLPKPIIALETSSKAVSLYDFQFPSIFTLAIGNEEFGCSQHTLSLADHLVEIPLRGRKNSLNVANAFAIAAAEIFKQKILLVN